MAGLFDIFRRKRAAPGRTKRAVPDFVAALAPEKPFVAIGDVHGCHGLLSRLLEKVEMEHADKTCVFVGDLIDRGEESAAVLKQVKDLCDAQPERFFCLMGNHEEMLVDCLENPERNASRWLRYGGLQTVASYRVPYQGSDGPDMLAARIAEAMGPEMVDWVAGLPTHWQTGNVHVVHAGADPRLPMDLQDPYNLKWGHELFFEEPRADGLWVVHGHTITEVATAEAGRISTDTGAYATGRLTAAIVESGGARFIEA